MCAADIIFTYSQARLGLTHYLFFVGDNTSGKSNNLTLIHILAYRNFMSSDMTAANVYQYLGSQEEGQGTLCIDEADQIDSNIDLMRIFKNGYTTGFPVARVDTSNGRKQQRFFTFGFKAFSAERLPDSLTAKGFNQRVIVLSCTYGIPQYDISEILNPAGEGEYEAQLAELYDMRNTLLVYGLLHHYDNIPNIPVNLSGREKQLFKPVIRVFQNTESQKELLQVVSKYVGQRREQNANSLHSFLYRLVTDLIKTQGINELESTLIWNTLTDVLPGDAIPNKKLSYESSEFGPLSQKGVVEILIQVFGAKHSLSRRDKRKLIFDMSKLKRLGQVYNVSVEVKVGTGVTDETDVTDIGLQRYVQEHDQATNNGTKERDSSRDHSDDNINGISSREAITNKSSDSMEPYTNNPSQVSHPSHQIMPTPIVEHERDQTICKTIYRIHPHSDIFGCNNCKLKGDKWEMQEHRCRGSRK